jgi:hypothetical protein
MLGAQIFPILSQPERSLGKAFCILCASQEAPSNFVGSYHSIMSPY